MQTDFIDYSQFSSYQKCPFLWYERYIAGLEKARNIFERKTDALTVGSLVHSGLQGLYKTGNPDIAQETIEELYAAPEAVLTARTMLTEYIRCYWADTVWHEMQVEQPIRATITTPLGNTVPILAKIDTYGEVPPDTFIYNGPGQIDKIYLEPGYWIIEHKTKSAETTPTRFMQRWLVDKQADFQMLALQQCLQAPVQGLIVNVLEKPRNSVPRRKCKGCGDYFEYAGYLKMLNSDKHSCPMCGHEQKLSPLGHDSSYAANCYRLVVTRSQAALESTSEHIYRVYQGMIGTAANGPGQMTPTFTTCVHSIYGPCEFFEPHVIGNQLAKEGLIYRKRENVFKYIEETV